MLINRSFKPCFKKHRTKLLHQWTIPKLEIFSSLYNFHELVPVAVFSQWHKGKEEAKKNNSEKKRRSPLPIRKRLPVTQRVTTPYCCPTDNLINYRQISYSLIFYYLKEKERHINPLTHQSDKHPISPNSTSLKSNIKVMRIKEMISNSKSSWL